MFVDRYASISKQEEISQRLESLRLEEYMNTSTDQYAALDQLVKRIIKLVPMAEPKDQDDEAKVRFLCSAVIGVKCGLRAIFCFPSDPSFPRLLSALTTSLREIYMYLVKSRVANDGHPQSTGGYGKSLWDSHSKRATESEALYTEQLRYGRDPMEVSRFSR